MQRLSDLLLTASREEYDLRDLTFSAEDCPELTLGSIDLKCCTFTRCSFQDCNFRGTGFSQVIFEDCDLSGARFHESGLRNVIFRDCRLMGTVFSESTLNETEFLSCQGRYLNLSGCTLKHCRFVGGVYKSGGFSNLKCTRTTVDGCDFTQCDFSGTALSGFDFSGCTIDGARWSLDRLRGAVFTTLQAVELARLLGIELVP